MTKQEALSKLKQHGVELIFVTDRTYKWDQINMAREENNIPSDAVVPTREQYDKIIEIVDEDGLNAIMKEYIEHGWLNIWSSSESSPSFSLYLYFTTAFSSQSSWNFDSKAYGFSVAFWKLPKDF